MNVNSYSKFFTFFILLLIFIACSWNLFSLEIYQVHDISHSARIAEMSKAISDGHIPVRWTQNFGRGYGMPVFEFYAPLPYYLGSLFYSISGKMMLTIVLLFFIVNAFSVFGSYFLGRKLYGNLSGLLVSAAFSLAPYRASDIFVRGALSELWGIMLMPWILLFIIGIVDRKNKQYILDKYWIGLVMALFFLILSHNLTTMLFVPISIVFALLYLISRDIDNKKNALKKIYEFGSAYLLAFGLSSFYWLPIIFEIGYVKIQVALVGYYHYANHFIKPSQFVMDSWGYKMSNISLENGISFFLGWGQLVALTLLVFIILSKFYKKYTKKNKKNSTIIEPFTDKSTTYYLLILFIIIFLVSGFFSIDFSRFFWKLIPLLEYLQFPWRFMMLVILSLSLIVGYSITLIKDRVWQFIIFSLIMFFMFFNLPYFKFISDDVIPWEYSCFEVECIQKKLTHIMNEYLPAGVKSYSMLPEPETLFEDEWVINKTHKKVFEFGLEEESSISLPVFAYQGWKTDLDGHPIDWNKDEFGRISVLVPEGKHILVIEFVNSPARNIADTTCLVSIIIFLFLLIRKSISLKKEI